MHTLETAVDVAACLFWFYYEVVRILFVIFCLKLNKENFLLDENVYKWQSPIIHCLIHPAAQSFWCIGNKYGVASSSVQSVGSSKTSILYSLKVKTLQYIQYCCFYVCFVRTFTFWFRTCTIFIEINDDDYRVIKMTKV